MKPLLLEDEDLDAEEAVLEVEEVGECTNRKASIYKTSIYWVVGTCMPIKIIC